MIETVSVESDTDHHGPLFHPGSGFFEFRGGTIPPSPASYMRFPGEYGGKSLAEMAQRDLKVALQLLAERAQYITGASGAAIALREDEELICRARAGPSAPGAGAATPGKHRIDGRERPHPRNSAMQ